MNIHTGRDPFARHTIRRRKVHTATGCTWCGSSRQNPKTAQAYLWQYFVDADCTRESGDIKGQFCGIDCLNAYHG